MNRSNRDVRFAPESGHSSARSGCLLWPIADMEQLFDHLVGALLKMQRQVEAEHLGGL
jgi:hypothetical protein